MKRIQSVQLEHQGRSSEDESRDKLHHHIHHHGNPSGQQATTFRPRHRSSEIRGFMVTFTKLHCSLRLRVWTKQHFRMHDPRSLRASAGTDLEIEKDSLSISIQHVQLLGYLRLIIVQVLIFEMKKTKKNGVSFGCTEIRCSKTAFWKSVTAS